MRPLLRIFFVLLCCLVFFELVVRLIGKGGFDALSKLLNSPQAHAPTNESLAYKAWFLKNYNQDEAEALGKHWLATNHLQPSRAFRHWPLLEKHSDPMIYSPGKRNFILKSTDGQIIREAVVNIEEDGYRKTILPKGIEDSVSYIFTGASFTFGYGLNDDETFASKFALFKNAYVKNLGLNGPGPNSLLYLFRDQRKLKLPQLESKTIRIIYTFNMKQYERVFMSSYCVEEDPYFFFESFPYYREKNGKLEYQGTFGEQYLKVWLYRLYNLSAARTVLGITAHPSWESLNKELALFYKELKQFFIVQYPNSKVEFYFSPFPFRSEFPGEKLLDELNQVGIKTISFADTPLDDILPENFLWIPTDVHPSPMSATLYAKMLADYFNKQNQ